ncbi:MAG: lycopene cyclase domain-containing protein [Elusimicrobiota bacterium]|jgi:lycopene cyclase domain-containing protein
MPLYFLSTLAYFWIPALVLGFWLYPLQDRLSRKAFWLALACILPMTAVMEYVYLYCGIWGFSQAKDPLLGIWIFGAPIEEFMFWFGAPPFILLAYWGFVRLLGKKRAYA